MALLAYPRAARSTVREGWRRHFCGPACLLEDGFPSNLALRQLAAYTILPNIPFWLAAHFFLTIPRAPLNLDYLAAGLLGLFLSRARHILVFAVLCAIDILGSTAYFYYFTASDLLDAAKYFVEFPWKNTALLGLSAACVSFVLAFLAVQISRPAFLPQRRLAAAILAVLLLVLGLPKLFYHLRDARENFPVVTSASEKLVLAVWRKIVTGPVAGANIGVRSATAALLEQARASAGMGSAPILPRNIVLVLVESYGLMTGAPGAEKLESPYHAAAVLDRYEVQTGAIEFRGATVSGELRELCGVQGGVGTARRARLISGDCLPALLEAKGYATSAIHGFRGALFDRKTWYRDLGFEDTKFLEDLRDDPSAHRCAGAVPGICDADIASMLGRALGSPVLKKPQFLYWVTLNSHLPVTLVNSSSSPLNCGSPQAAHPDASICSWMGLVYAVHSAIAKLSVEQGLPPTEFIIVGDHAPPFWAAARRAQFSQEFVPYIRLVPKIRDDRK